MPEATASLYHDFFSRFSRHARAVIVPRRDSLLLADRFADPLVIEHPGGHVIPADSAVTAPIADFLDGFARHGTADPALDESRSSR